MKPTNTVTMLDILRGDAEAFAEAAAHFRATGETALEMLSLSNQYETEQRIARIEGMRA